MFVIKNTNSKPKNVNVEFRLKFSIKIPRVTSGVHETVLS